MTCRIAAKVAAKACPQQGSHHFCRTRTSAASVFSIFTILSGNHHLKMARLQTGIGEDYYLWPDENFLIKMKIMIIMTIMKVMIIAVTILAMVSNTVIEKDGTEDDGESDDVLGKDSISMRQQLFLSPWKQNRFRIPALGIKNCQTNL